MSNERIAVLGGGPMGLAVAYQLARDGHTPTLFEASTVLGGMSASFSFGSLRIERFYHFHCQTDQDLFHLLNELGITNKLRWKSSNMGFYFDGSLMPWGNPLALLTFKGLSLFSKLRYGIHIYRATKRTRWESLDRQSATTWLEESCGKQAYNILWRKLFELKFYRYMDQVSAAWIWSRIRRLGRSRANLFKERLGYIEGGSETLLTALEKSIIENGGTIRCDTPVSKICIRNGVVEGIEIKGAVERFDKVISTIPLPLLPQLVPDLSSTHLAQYRAIDNIAVVCVIAKLKKPVSRYFWVNINDPRIGIPGIVEYSNLCPLKDSIVYAPFYMPRDHNLFSDPDTVFAEKVKAYLKIINPTLDDSDFIDIKVNRYAYAQPIATTGFLNKLPPVQLPVHGLYAADTSYYYPEDRGISESVGFGRKLAKLATTNGSFDLPTHT